jgi:FKBP-type peptidyl-prolyl cis-trans isomerase SlyD
MQISRHCVVALTWTLKDTLGEELDVLDVPVEFLVGGDDLLAAIESALQGCSAGSTVELQLEPEQAFGEFNDKLLFLEPRKLFPEGLQEGFALEGGALPTGCNPQAPKGALYTVTDIYPEHVVLDGNHPLAGIAIRLRMNVKSVREATVEEVGQGSCGTGFFKLHTP